MFFFPDFYNFFKSVDPCPPGVSWRFWDGLSSFTTKDTSLQGGTAYRIGHRLVRIDATVEEFLSRGPEQTGRT